MFSFEAFFISKLKLWLWTFSTPYTIHSGVKRETKREERWGKLHEREKETERKRTIERVKEIGLQSKV